MKTTLDLPDELVREMKLRAANLVLTASGLPVMVCAQAAPASLMALADLLALEQQAQTQMDAQRAGHFF